jgi:hypothetical protein
VTWVELGPTMPLISWIGTLLLLMIETAVRGPRGRAANGPGIPPAQRPRRRSSDALFRQFRAGVGMRRAACVVPQAYGLAPHDVNPMSPSTAAAWFVTAFPRRKILDAQ